VDSTGHIAFLNETWLVGSKWVGEYVRATVNTAQQTLTLWHQADADTDWRLIKTRQFRLKETVHAVLPPFRRNSARCRDYGYHYDDTNQAPENSAEQHKTRKQV
jgi:hypothetical protein